MSSLRNAIPRKAHKERAQHLRRKFGLLEKHKDYVIRARAYHQKEQTLLKLKEKAALRNPDKFYFKMIKTKTVGGVHKPESQANKYTNEELMLMKTQDIGYILQKLQTEKKKIERLNGMLHSLDNQSSSKHVYYAGNREEAREVRKKVSEQGNPSAFKDLPKGNHFNASLVQKRGNKRKLREDEMAHLAAHDDDMWFVITDGPMKIMKVNTAMGTTEGAPQMIEKHRSEWTAEDKKKANLDNVAKYILYKTLDKNMFAKIKTCTTAKEIWEKLTQLCEGNDQTK
ncbi:probable U3 small nucleolar RNA-associated protein 11 [Primulina eburnea]|uniref:probable U3 small nucleolar RNA-associated protein 11 n=1 Tax=Primulina eburnea TaxID=1245227 RepID=UPI003C6BE67B